MGSIVGKPESIKGRGDGSLGYCRHTALRRETGLVDSATVIQDML